MSLGSGRLMIHSYYGGARKPAVRHVDAPDVARAQEGVVADALEQARTALDADERSHRARYRNVKLIDLVPTFRGGVLRVGGHAGESAEAAVAAIRRAIGAFQRELAKRGMPAGRNHFVRLEVEDLQRALDGLRSERKVTRSRLTKLAKALARFQSVCREIDERYASDIIR
jgi:hypothetical protein